MVLRPPQSLIEDCAPPEESLDVLKLLKAGNIRGAAKAHAEYVLDVRDAFEICNGKFAAIREFYQGMEEEDE